MRRDLDTISNLQSEASRLFNIIEEIDRVINTKNSHREKINEQISRLSQQQIGLIDNQRLLEEEIRSKSHEKAQLVKSRGELVNQQKKLEDEKGQLPESDEAETKKIELSVKIQNIARQLNETENKISELEAVLNYKASEKLEISPQIDANRTQLKNATIQHEFISEEISNLNNQLSNMEREYRNHLLQITQYLSVPSSSSDVMDRQNRDERTEPDSPAEIDLYDVRDDVRAVTAPEDVELPQPHRWSTATWREILQKAKEYGVNTMVSNLVYGPIVGAIFSPMGLGSEDLLKLILQRDNDIVVKSLAQLALPLAGTFIFTCIRAGYLRITDKEFSLDNHYTVPMPNLDNPVTERRTRVPNYTANLLQVGLLFMLTVAAQTATRLIHTENTPWKTACTTLFSLMIPFIFAGLTSSMAANLFMRTVRKIACCAAEAEERVTHPAQAENSTPLLGSQTSSQYGSDHPERLFHIERHDASSSSHREREETVPRKLG